MLETADGLWDLYTTLLPLLLEKIYNFNLALRALYQVGKL